MYLFVWLDTFRLLVPLYTVIVLPGVHVLLIIPMPSGIFDSEISNLVIYMDVFYSYCKCSLRTTSPIWEVLGIGRNLSINAQGIIEHTS